jgi:hypothetical protein
VHSCSFSHALHLLGHQRKGWASPCVSTMETSTGQGQVAYERPHQRLPEDGCWPTMLFGNEPRKDVDPDEVVSPRLPAVSRITRSSAWPRAAGPTAKRNRRFLGARQGTPCGGRVHSFHAHDSSGVLRAKLEGTARNRIDSLMFDLGKAREGNDAATIASRTGGRARKRVSSSGRRAQRAPRPAPRNVRTQAAGLSSMWSSRMSAMRRNRGK